MTLRASPMGVAPRHLVLIPSYNTGSRLERTVREALREWPDVWVIVDGSTDGSDRGLEALGSEHGRLRVLRRPVNGGKGAAIATALPPALAEGFTHALVLDADGQHPSDQIVPFIEHSQASPDAMILGLPQFGPDAPWERLQGRKLSILLTHIETLSRAIGDPLFGFRVYPLAPLERAFAETSGARRYDFDPEIVVRLYWMGVRAINVPAACRYLKPGEGGVSHFHYIRDNLRMVALHARLLPQLLVRWPAIRRIRRESRRASAHSRTVSSST